MGGPLHHATTRRYRHQPVQKGLQLQPDLPPRRPHNPRRRQHDRESPRQFRQRRLGALVPTSHPRLYRRGQPGPRGTGKQRRTAGSSREQPSHRPAPHRRHTGPRWHPGRLHQRDQRLKWLGRRQIHLPVDPSRRRQQRLHNRCCLIHLHGHPRRRGV